MASVPKLGGMVPSAAQLPEVLPTERLLASGRPAPGYRDQLTRIPNTRNAIVVASHWLRRFVTVALVLWVGHPLAWVAGFVVMSREMVSAFILSHEAVHRLLFSDHRANDVVGRWLLAAPALLDNDAYRRAHLTHHRDELGVEEPDLILYAGYPTTPAKLSARLRRDAVGVTGWKVLRAQFRAGGPGRRRVVIVQAVLAVSCGLTGNPLVYPILFLLPWFTSWQVCNRLRSLAEHAGMERSSDRRRTTHVVRQSLLARSFLVPYNVGWHLAHHVDIAVPWSRLPALHRELQVAGWITDAIEYRSYPAFWRSLVSRDR